MYIYMNGTEKYKLKRMRIYYLNVWLIEMALYQQEHILKAQCTFT